MNRAIAAFCASMLLAAALPGQEPPRRLALLIHNSSYQHLPPLPSAAQDRAVLEEALRATGFDITVIDNRKLVALFQELNSGFLARVKPGDQCVVFYSGYGVQANQDNFLLAVDFDPAAAGDITTISLSLTRLQEELEERKAGLKLIFVDAARDVAALVAKSTGPGLTVPELSGSTEIAVTLSTAPNLTVPDPGGAAGLLASALSRAVRKPGLKILETLADLQRDVLAASTQRQQPIFFPKLSAATTQSFHFTAPLPVKKAPPPPPPVDLFTKLPQTNRTDRQEYVFIPAGKFQMGCVPSEQKDERCEAEENPRHEVTISKAFWLGVTEVTIDAFRRFVDSDKKRKMPKLPFWEPPDNHPMVQVSWQDAQSYCEWVGGRLPSEAEWEYAARGGRQDTVYPHSGSDSRDKANFSGKKGNDRYDYSAPVKSFDPNGYGLFDMSGNVWEWCWDWFDKNYYAGSPAADPKGPASGKEKSVRGGSFYSDALKHLRISFRHAFPPKAGDLTGFRCLLEDSPQTRQRFAAR
jgi:formylglycine-generating enzyme required for sulfatase activity